MENASWMDGTGQSWLYAAMIGLRINVKKTKVLHVGEQEDRLMADGLKLSIDSRTWEVWFAETAKFKTM